MNAIRSLIFVIWLYGTMLVLGILGLPTLLLPRQAPLAVMKLYARMVVFGLRWIAGVRLEFRGLQHVPEGPVIIAGKHQAMLDVFAPFVMFKDPVVVMKRELLWYPILGWYCLRTGMIAIDRAGSARTVKLMLKAAQEKVAIGAGRQMIIFPEGTRSLPGAVPDYKPAGLRTFYKALQLPILPVATNSGQCWPAHGLIRTPGTVVYEVMPAIEPGLHHKEMLAQVTSRLEDASTALLAINPR